jgi:large subunit ribosomal protein L13
MQYTIDATNKKLGRIATEAAALLSGKSDVNYAPNRVSDVKVTIENASKIDLSESRKNDDTYSTYSGYPGGLRYETRGHLIDRRGYGEMFMRTIRGMLPRNKLRSHMLKNLTIKD